jgi:hypothetical protein
MVKNVFFFIAGRLYNIKQSLKLHYFLFLKFALLTLSELPYRSLFLHFIKISIVVIQPKESIQVKAC